MGKLVYSLSDFQQAAITFRNDLLRIPVMGLEEILPFVTLRPGVTYEEIVGTSSVNAQLAPYKKNQRTDANLNLALRSLKTYFGSVNADFDPNEEIQTLLGHRAAQAMGEGLKSVPQAQEVLACVAKALGAHLNNTVWNAVRKATGTTTKDLYDGFDTITAKEITEGNISAANKNLIELDEEITAENAVEILKSILYFMDPLLRKEECFLYCSYDIADAYNENYLLTHAGVMYNQDYNQVYLEGSNKRVTIVPLASKQGSQFIHVAPKRNMLIGVDQISDQESIEINKYAPDTLTYEARMFFGCQFESIDKTRMLVAKLHESTTEQPGQSEEPENP